MKKLLCLIISSFLMLGICQSSFAEAADIKADNQKVQTQKKKEKKNTSRFVELFKDNSFVYYMDMKSAQWILCPNTSEEYIADVWIKMIPEGQEKSNLLKEDNMASKYYMEHYYIRPAKRQIQFMCELEVSGRPSNNLKQREYRPENWENLIPGSIEDEIYNTVLDAMKKHKKGSSNDNGKSGNNFIEEVLRISI